MIFNLDLGEGASKSGNLYILPDRTDPTNKADRYTYDYRNRLIKVEHTDNYGATPPTWSTLVTYYYDGLNRRVKKDLTSGTDVIYLNDGWHEPEEREWDSTDSRWEPRRQFLYGGLYIDEPLIFDKDTDNDGDCTDAGGSSRYFYAQQANWNVMAVTSSDGTVVEKVKYDPYGQATVTVQQGQTASGNPCLFQGRRLDSEVGLYYFRSRVQSPVFGRFWQRDNARCGQNENLYSFVANNPLNSVDPFGLKKECTAWTLIQFASCKDSHIGGSPPIGYCTYAECHFVRLCSDDSRPEGKWCEDKHFTVPAMETEGADNPDWFIGLPCLKLSAPVTVPLPYGKVAKDPDIFRLCGWRDVTPEGGEKAKSEGRANMQCWKKFREQGNK
jgi:RHS repeat-associated protein